MRRTLAIMVVVTGVWFLLGSAPADAASTTSLDDPFDGTAGTLLDPLLWNTRDDDSGAGVVDFGGEAQAGTNGRGVVEEDGNDNVSVEGDLFPLGAWGELGFVSVDSVVRPGPTDDPLYLYFWNARSDEIRSKVFMGLSNRDDSVALGVIREGYGWSIQGGQIEVAIEDLEYTEGLVGIPADQFFPVNPIENEGGPHPFDNVAHDFRLKITDGATELQYKEIFSETWLSPDWSLFGGPPTSNTVGEMWIVVGGKVGDPDQIDHTDFLIDRIELTTSDFNCQDGGACPPRTEPRVDDFDGSAGQLVDPSLWNTRDADSGANVVDVGGDAQAGTDGRGVVELDGSGQGSIEGDLASPAEFGQLGMVSVDAVRRPIAGEDPVYVYFWNARSDQYRSKIILGLSYRPDSVSVGEIRQGYAWSIVGGGASVAVEDTEYAGGDLGIPDEFFPVNPLPDEGGPDPLNNKSHDFRIKVTDADVSFQYKTVDSKTWLSPNWAGVGGKPTTDGVKTMWVALGGKVGLAADIDHTDFLVDKIEVTTADLDCQGSFCAANGDFDLDGDVDLTDYGSFLSCYNGPGNPPGQSGCDDADFDNDGDVDLSDYGVFLGCYNGPNKPPACS
jgi:hypothetical protein